MDFAELGPNINDYNILDNLAPTMDPNVNWLGKKNTPIKKISNSYVGLQNQKHSNLNLQRVIKDVDLGTLNDEQQFVLQILEKQLADGYTDPLLVIGSSGTEKSTFIKVAHKVFNEIHLHSLLRLGTTSGVALLLLEVLLILLCCC